MLVTGNRESGKTSLCFKIVKNAVEKGLSVEGLISQKLFEKGKAKQIFCIDIKSGEKTPLALWEPGWDAINPMRDWKVNPAAPNWGNERLARIIRTDILIVDELGYQEFEQNSGWVTAFNIIGKKEIGISIVVVRPSLIHKAKEHWPNAVEVNLDRDSQEEIMITVEKYLLAIAKEKKRNADRNGDIE